MTTASRVSHRLAVVAVVAVCAAVGATGVAQAAGWAIFAVAGSNAQTQSVHPVAPSGVTATCTSRFTARTITVTWTGIAHASYQVFQSTTSSTSGFALVGSTSATSWTSASLSSATYWYEVAAAYGSTWVSPRSVATASHTIASSSPYCS